MTEDAKKSLATATGRDGGNAKVVRIRRAAREAFLAQGYERTSMDTVARNADVSKTTLYAHFPSKERLFLAVLEAEKQAMGIPNVCAIPDGSIGVRESLRANARTMLAKMTSPALISLFRMVLAESGRSPDLGRNIWEDGPARGTARMARLLQHFAERGELRIDDHDLAALRFVSLVYGGLHAHCLLDREFRPSPDELAEHVERCLDFFLAYYGSEKIGANPA